MYAKKFEFGHMAIATFLKCSVWVDKIRDELLRGLICQVEQQDTLEEDHVRDTS